MEGILTRTRWFFSGLALFSLYFGAGNIIFPLILGRMAEGSVGIALVGFCVTAVLVPLAGLLGMTFFQGNYEDFFKVMGRIPGKVIIFFLLALIGPFGGIPRCISLTYATLSVYIPDMRIVGFGSVFALLVFTIALYKPKGVWLLSYLALPVILFFLLKGMVSGNLHSVKPALIDPLGYGVHVGYNTMDFLAVFFFAPILFQKFMEGRKGGTVVEFVKASLVGALLLTLVYAGFALTGAFFSKELAYCSPDHLLGELGKLVLGKTGGLIVSIAILFSCLTAAVTLTTLTADFVRDRLFKNRIGYDKVLVLVLGTSVLVATLGFSKIVAFLAPVLHVCYPSLLALCICNVLRELYGFRWTQLSVYFVIAVVIISKIFG